MGIAFLEVSQAGSSSRPSKTDRTAAPRDMGREWAVVQEAIAGDASAHEQLFAPSMRSLYRAVLAVLQNKEDAEDALQEGWCKAFTSLRSFEGRSSFSTWLTRIVVNSALMARRRKLTHPEASLDEMQGYRPVQLPRGVVDARPDPEELYAATEFNARVEEHVSQLPAARQMAIRLHALYGFPAPHSGKALGISASAIKSRIFRARLKLACRLPDRLR